MKFTLTYKNFLFLGSTIISAFFGLIITIFIAKSYSKDVNASYQYYLTFFQLVSLFGWARSDQFLLSVKYPPNIIEVIKYLFKNQILNWILIVLFSLFFFLVTGNKYIDSLFSLFVILISGYFFGLTNISNQFLIVSDRYEYQGVYDFLQKFIFFLLLFFFTSLNVYIGLLFLVSMLIRFVIFKLNDKKFIRLNKISDLHIMISNGKRMFLANSFTNIASFVIVYIISNEYSKSFYADYALVSILISFPASVMGQYIGLMIHRRYVNGSKEFIIIFKLLIFSSTLLLMFYLFLPYFKSYIINLIGKKWSTIWDIYNLLWPLSIFSFIASILERTGYELGSKKWPIFISFFRFLGIVLLFSISYFEDLFEITFGLSYFILIAVILYLSYIIDLIRNLFFLYRESVN
jgi:hypothetical protein